MALATPSTTPRKIKCLSACSVELSSTWGPTWGPRGVHVGSTWGPRGVQVSSAGSTSGPRGTKPEHASSKLATCQFQAQFQACNMQGPSPVPSLQHASSKPSSSLITIQTPGKAYPAVRLRILRIHLKNFQVREFNSSPFSPSQFVKATGGAYIFDNVQSLTQTSRPLTIDH